MSTTHSVVSVFSAAMMVLGASVAFGQNYPNRPIRIFTATVGGAGDIVARLVAEGIAGPLGQQAIVENRAATIAPELVSKAPPDGYALYVAGGTFWIAPLLTKTPYDPVRDFSTISLLSRLPNLLVVHPSLPVKSVKELIALAKAQPGALNYASGPIGGAGHIAGAYFASMAGINVMHIPYQNVSQRQFDLLSGMVHMMFESPAGLLPLVKLGKLRALAVTTAEPSALVPGVPTVAASGLPGYSSEQMFGMFAPDKTPEAIIKRLNQEIVRVLNRADMKEKFLSSGLEAVSSSPEDLAAAVKSEMAKVGKVIKDAGIKVN